jgi:xylan 1,4-beta-xylosidase
VRIITRPLVTLSLWLVAAVSWGQQPQYTNPVLPGDYPDPSVIRVGDDYWATATSSEWGPQFPILHSRDLVNWEIVGSVFDERPKWATSNFWAPEIAAHNGRYFIYYVGRNQQGQLAVAVASADKPRGPYVDHGQLVSQQAGSIDGMAFTDQAGQRWLMWKEDGNSRNEPTPLWLQRLSDDGLKLVGGRSKILQNDAAWEGKVVEGPFVLFRNGWYYLFYAGGACLWARVYVQRGCCPRSQC